MFKKLIPKTKETIYKWKKKLTETIPNRTKKNWNIFAWLFNRPQRIRNEFFSVNLRELRILLFLQCNLCIYPFFLILVSSFFSSIFLSFQFLSLFWRRKIFVYSNCNSNFFFIAIAVLIDGINYDCQFIHPWCFNSCSCGQTLSSCRLLDKDTFQTILFYKEK